MRILVLAGGHSSERKVSLESGRCVAEALEARGHSVEILDPETTELSTIDSTQYDIAVPMVHGTGGEDGALQRQLDDIGIKYLGSSAVASELTFSKIRTNNLLRQNGVLVPSHCVVHNDQQATDLLKTIQELGFPVVTKPPRQGSSVGISIVQHEDDIEDALAEAFRYGNECMVETYIAGREVTVPVIDGTAFPIVEIRPAAEWYDYAAKYQDDRTEYLVSPPNIDSSVKDLANQACRICGVTGITRVDFRIDPDGRAYLLEINTIPGMTSHSLVPKSAASLGYSLADVCELAIRNRINA